MICGTIAYNHVRLQSSEKGTGCRAYKSREYYEETGEHDYSRSAREKLEFSK